MLLTVSQRLHIKPSTFYVLANQGNIPCRKIHGLVRFDPTEIDHGPFRFRHLIARAKRAVYTSVHGETRPRSSLIGKGERDGALEA